MGISILHIRSNQSLKDTSVRVFRALGITDYSAHDSDNYPQGKYFQGLLEHTSIKVAHEDDARYGDYQYWVIVKTPIRSTARSVETLTNVASLLVQNGFEICREPESLSGITPEVTLPTKD